MADRMLLLPAPGVGETRCDQCRYYEKVSHWGETYCAAFRVDFPDITRLRLNPNDDRLPDCLHAEQSARSQAAELARLRRVEEAARTVEQIRRRLEYAVGWSEREETAATLKDAKEALRVALEER